jgi:hypothetical protein
MSNVQVQTTYPRGYQNGSGDKSLSEPVSLMDKWEPIRRWLHSQFSYKKEEALTTSKSSPPYALIGILVTILIWATTVTVAGVWMAATMSASIQSLKEQNIEEKIHHREAELASEQRYQAALTASESRVESRITAAEQGASLNLVYIKDIRESLIARGIIKKGNN